MKDLERAQAAADEIAEVCRRHRVFLIGTDRHEVYGEITFVEADETIWFGWRGQVTNQVKWDSMGDSAFAEGIG